MKHRAIFKHALHPALYLLGAGCGVAFSCTAMACEVKDKTELEEIYCTLKSKNRVSTLPDFNQFRKNSDDVQWLLLKGPARKAGITLPPKSSLKPKTNTAPLADRKTDNKAADNQVNTSAQSNPLATQTTRTATSSNSSLANCSLKPTQIQCSYATFTLQYNLPNSKLAPAALKASNQLTLPAYNSKFHASERDYLARCYPVYVNKILELGLAEAVMSYTKFVSQYEEVVQHGGNFANRMQKMYEILKQEKRSRPIQASYQHTRPQSIEQCMLVSNSVIVCDNIAHTWVFTLPQPKSNAD
ncbi:hypothetical protein [Saccharophagus degradans]|uniref:Lipoprotein n=1 Tax=Saccharophagus degradans (strain 2-40 / ATCC 43961 / DSM 17024) TaxID=203122 RepID=Q21IF9_SACD2|nr:hypothetical protein [Saccharophagus degradans]ABD81520.1 conserved hypothetical protein [Saccharophagus degradans 2-40]